MEHEPRISTAEAIVWTLVGIIADIVSIIPIINIIVAIIFNGLFLIYSSHRGIKNQKAMFGMIIEWIPFLSILPAYTTIVLISIYLDRHPKSQLAKAASVASVTNIRNPKKALPTPLPTKD